MRKLVGNNDEALKKRPRNTPRRAAAAIRMTIVDLSRLVDPKMVWLHFEPPPQCLLCAP
jgi:hypothetical protein